MGVHKTHGPGSTEDAVKAIVQEVGMRELERLGEKR